MILINLQSSEIWRRVRKRRWSAKPENAAKRVVRDAKYRARPASKQQKAKRENTPKYKARSNERERRWRDANVSKARAIQQRYKYGVDAHPMLEAQAGLCAACSRVVAFGLPPKQGGACVDHCHATGKVRGVLCFACNVALGAVREDVNVLCGLAEYLEKHNGRGPLPPGVEVVAELPADLESE